MDSSKRQFTSVKYAPSISEGFIFITLGEPKISEFCAFT